MPLIIELVQNSWVAIDVIAAMLVDDNKRFLNSFYCWFHCHVFVIWFSRDWLQVKLLHSLIVMEVERDTWVGIKPMALVFFFLIGSEQTRGDLLLEQTEKAETK